MKRTLILSFAFITSLSFASQDSLESRIDSLFREFDSNSSPGASIAVLQNNELVYQKSFGMANITLQIPIKSKTNFRLASITKQFTALSILLLENKGKISLNNKITDYFSELDHYAKNITIKNVLQHTSGFFDYEEFIDKSVSTQLKDNDVLNILASQNSTYFNPGTKHRYSNSGYAVLALLVERISELSFANFLDRRIFKPLKMNTTLAYEKGISEVTNRAYGYTKTDSGFVFTDQSLTSAVLGDGGIYSSINDLIKWDNEVNSPTLLPREKFQKAFEKGKTSDDNEFDYGLGWRLDPYKGLIRHYHTGGTMGFTNIYMRVPELDLTIIVLMNIIDNNAKDYAEKIADIFIHQNNFEEK